MSNETQNQEIYIRQLESILGTIVIIGIGCVIFKTFKQETIHVLIR